MGALPFPLPFITALLAGILALRVSVTAHTLPAARNIFAALFAVMALRALTVGLRFGYGVDAAGALQPVLAMMLPPLAWLGFRSMTVSPPTLDWKDWVRHGAPIVAVATAVVASSDPRWSWPIDLAVAASYIVYAGLLLRLFRAGAAAFSPLDAATVGDARRQLLVIAVLMLVSAFVDAWILVGVVASGGRVPLTPIVGAHVFAVATLVLLLALAPQRMLGTLAARVLPKPAPDAEADAALVGRLRDLMAATALYTDPTIDAARLAKRLGVPLRRMSAAVNGQLGLNVSQFVNDYRVEAACRLLTESDTTVTAIMLAVGFETKSNFNREFQRVTGISPSAWRKSRRTWAVTPALEHFHARREMLGLK